LGRGEDRKEGGKLGTREDQINKGDRKQGKDSQNSAPEGTQQRPNAEKG